MITTAVHQASQLVEIQGAPPPVESGGGDFRAAFTASVDETTTPKAAQLPGQTAGAAAGAASAKHPPAAGPTAKATSLAAQAALRLKTAGPEETAVETAALGAADTAPKANSAPVSVLGSDPGSDLGSDLGSVLGSVLVLGSASADAAKAVRSEPASGPDLKATGLVLLSLPVAASGAATTVQGSRVEDKPSESETARASKDESPAAASEKNAADGPRSTAAPATDAASLANLATVPLAVSLDTAAIAQAVQASALAAASLSQKGTRQGLPLRALDTGGVAKAASLRSAGATAGGDLASTAAGSKAQASFQPAISAATEDLKGGAQSDTVAAAVRPASTGIAPVLTPATDGAEGKTGSPSGPTESPTKGPVQPHPAQTRSPLPSSASSTEGTVSSQLSAAEDQSAGSAVSLSNIGNTIAGAEVVSTHGQLKPDPQVDTQPGIAPAALPVTQASPGSALSAAKNDIVKNEALKDEKSKSVAAASDETGSVRSNAVAAQSAAITNGSTNFAAATGVTAARAAPDTVAPSAQPTAHVAASPTHSGVAGPSRAASAASLAEPASALVQSGESHRTLLATPTALEVGVQGGTQGWLRIRAEVGGAGEVNASLSAASSGGRELLHSQLPALNAFLHSEQLAVTATVAEHGLPGAGGSQQGAAFAGGAGAGLGTALGTALGTGAGADGAGGSHGSLLQGDGSPSGGGQREPVPQPTGINATERAESYDPRTGVSDAAGVVSGNATGVGESGRWLNVRV